jgi:hypothetical protein
MNREHPDVTWTRDEIMCLINCRDSHHACKLGIGFCPVADEAHEPAVDEIRQKYPDRATRPDPEEVEQLHTIEVKPSLWARVTGWLWRVVQPRVDTLKKLDKRGWE